MISRSSTSPPGVNQVDGLPPVLNTEAVWGAHGVFGPAAIGNFDKKCIRLNKTIT